MNKIIAVVFTVSLMALASCSSSVPSKNYFQLTTSLDKMPSQTAHKPDRFILIESVDVDDFLNKNGIVIQTDPIKYTTAANNLWTSPLSKQLENRVTRDLSLLLPDYLVSTKPLKAPYLKVKLFIEGFHGSYTGDAVIKGRWVITKNSHDIYSKVFERKVPLTHDGYDALVNALSAAWQQEELDLAHNLQ